MKKLILLLVGLYSTLSFAETSRSILLDSIPNQCDGSIILGEIPMVQNSQQFLIAEVLDVQNIKMVSRTSSELVCYANLITEERALNKVYQITFRKNSLGDVLVSYK